MEKEENGNQPFELLRGELLEDGNEEGKGDVEGTQGGDGPGGEGKAGALLWLGIPHVGHSQCENPPKICINVHRNGCNADVGDGAETP